MPRPSTPMDLYHSYRRADSARSRSESSLPSLHGFTSALNLPPSNQSKQGNEGQIRLSTISTDSATLYAPPVTTASWAAIEAALNKTHPTPRPSTSSSTYSTLYAAPNTAARWALIEAALDSVHARPKRTRSLSAHALPKSSPCPIRRSIAAVCEKPASPPKQTRNPKFSESTDHTSRTHDFRRFSVSHLPIFHQELPPIDFSRPVFNTESVLSEILSSLHDSDPDHEDNDAATDFPTFQSRTAEGVESTAGAVPQPPTPDMGRSGGVAYNGREELRQDMDFLRSTEAMDEFLRVARGRWRDK